MENVERVPVSTNYSSVGLEHDFSDLCDNEIKLQVLAGIILIIENLDPRTRFATMYLFECLVHV